MSLLDENFDITDVQTLGSMCTRVYKEFFNLNCNVVFDGIGKIKLEDILEHPTRYALASRSLPNWDDPTEYIRICRKEYYSSFWDIYSQLNIKYVLKIAEHGIIR